jgi:hypothetical protein
MRGGDGSIRTVAPLLQFRRAAALARQPLAALPGRKAAEAIHDDWRSVTVPPSHPGISNGSCSP